MSLSCPLVCASLSSRVPGNFKVVLLLPFAIFIFPLAIAGWNSSCMSSNSHPPPHQVFHPSHLFISLLCLSPAASISLPGKSCPRSPPVWWGILQYLCVKVLVGNGTFVFTHFMSSSCDVPLCDCSHMCVASALSCTVQSNMTTQPKEGCTLNSSGCVCVSAAVLLLILPENKCKHTCRPGAHRARCVLSMRLPAQHALHGLSALHG